MERSAQSVGETVLQSWLAVRDDPTFLKYVHLSGTAQLFDSIRDEPGVVKIRGRSAAAELESYLCMDVC